jgi:hypothetical protein
MTLLVNICLNLNKKKLKLLISNGLLNKLIFLSSQTDMSTSYYSPGSQKRNEPKTLLDVVSGIASDRAVSSLAQSYGLDVNTVSWEDVGRSKGSCWGPNITDMTLCTEKRNMPVLRKPNFADVTADRPLTDFTVMVGNETGSELKQVTLKQYLENINTYTGNPNIKSLLCERDNTVLTSAQACVLPLTDGAVEFCVQMYNYQSYDSGDPAILVIMVSAQGTSTQVVYGNTPIYFNDNGEATNMRAERLSDDRKKRSVPVDGPMTAEEKNRNALFIYQVPLKQKPRQIIRKCMGERYMTVPMGMKSRGFEKAVLSKGRSMGKHTGTNGLTLERDYRFPIRCTVQYYNVTDIAQVTEDQVKEIASTIDNTYKTAQATGSLVLGTTDRKTEPVLSPSVPFTATATPLVGFL